LVLVDELCWDPGWVSPPPEEQARRILPRLADERWVFDSIYGTFLPPAGERAQVIVGLDYPRWLSFGRLVRRTCTRWWTQEEVCNGNRETLRAILGRDSILVWHFRSFARKRDRLRRWHADPDELPVVLLRSPRDAEALVGWLARRREG